MLNSKKSFLQKARIAMVAIVTIMSLGGAYAMNAPKHQDSTTWGVVSTSANAYKVTALTPTFGCSQSTRVCTITSAVAPDGNGNIAKSNATVQDMGTFHK